MDVSGDIATFLTHLVAFCGAGWLLFTPSLAIPAIALLSPFSDLASEIHALGQPRSTLPHCTMPTSPTPMRTHDRNDQKSKRTRHSSLRMQTCAVGSAHPGRIPLARVLEVVPPPTPPRPGATIFSMKPKGSSATYDFRTSFRRVRFCASSGDPFFRGPSVHTCMPNSCK